MFGSLRCVLFVVLALFEIIILRKHYLRLLGLKVFFGSQKLCLSSLPGSYPTHHSQHTVQLAVCLSQKDKKDKRVKND
jgi:hypothetical protein